MCGAEAVLDEWRRFPFVARTTPVPPSPEAEDGALRDSWSPAEKAVARRAYDEALEVVRAGIMAEVKRRAAAAETMKEIWALEGYLQDARRQIDLMFDYRYSQLILVFAGLINNGYIDEARLDGLAEDKREAIRGMIRFRAGPEGRPDE